MNVRSAALALVGLASIAACGGARPYARAVSVEGEPQRVIAIAGTQRGFEPARIDVRAGEVVQLVVTRTGTRDCMEEIEIWLDDTRTVVHRLELGESAAVTLRFDAPGVLGIATGDRHFGAAIEVRDVREQADGR